MFTGIDPTDKVFFSNIAAGYARLAKERTQMMRRQRDENTYQEPMLEQAKTLVHLVAECHRNFAVAMYGWDHGQAVHRFHEGGSR